MRALQAAVGGLLLVSLLPANHAALAEPPASKRVLLLHQAGVGAPVRARFNAAFIEALRSHDSTPVDLYEEVIETASLAGAEHSDAVREYLQRKYANRIIDVIVAQGSVPLAFARQNRALFGNPPIVAVAMPAGQIEGATDDVTGLQGGMFATGTIALAMALRPDTETVFVIDGARENTGEIQGEVERQVKELSRPIRLVYLRDLALKDLLARVAEIPDRSIVLFVRQTMRTASEDVDQFEALTQIMQASPVPVFSQMEELIGRGVLGGYVWRFEADARRLAEMARLIATGTSVRDIPPGRTSYSRLLDWRALQRWNVPESRLPAGSVVLFRPQSFFMLYRKYVIAGVLIFTAQLSLIAGLLVQRGRRRHAEDLTRHSEARYRSVVDTQTELICRFLPDTTLTFVNGAYARFWNKSRTDLLGRKFIDLVPDDTRDEVLARIERLTSGFDSHEHQVTLPDGTVGWQHWVNHAIVDERGGVVEIQGVGRDITDRKRAEEALKHVEARNSAILRAVPDLMFVIQRDGTYLDFHARDPKVLVVPPEEFIGKRIHDIMPPELVAKLMDGIERACLTSEPVLVEYELKMGDARSFEARLVSFEHDRVLSIVRDITDTKRAIERNRDLAGRLIASQEEERTRIARDLHDGVCQEIAALSVDVSHLRRKRGEIQSRLAQDILMAVQRRTATLAETLRLLSHDLHSSTLHHIGLVAALQSHCAEVERQHDLRVTFISEPDVEPRDRTVALALFRIAQEALSNAARHGHARRATVSLAREDAVLTLAVADDGHGFDVQVAQQNGGLGLVSMEERARLVHGQVRIHSEPVAGTIVNVSIPIDPVDDAETPEHEPVQPRVVLLPLMEKPTPVEASSQDATPNRLAG